MQGEKSPNRHARRDSCGSTDDSGSDDHARTAWTFFGVGKLDSAHKTWSSPSAMSQDRDDAVGTLPTPTYSPLPVMRRLGEKGKGKERVFESVSQSIPPLAMPVKNSLRLAATEIDFSPNPVRMASFASPCTSPFVSFNDIWITGQPLEEHTNEAIGSGSQPFAVIDNVVVSDSAQDTTSSHHLVCHQSQGKHMARSHSIVLSNVDTKVDAENVNETPPSKRRRIEREASELTEAWEPLPKPFTGLARTPTEMTVSRDATPLSSI